VESEQQWPVPESSFDAGDANVTSPNLPSGQYLLFAIVNAIPGGEVVTITNHATSYRVGCGCQGSGAGTAGLMLLAAWIAKGVGFRQRKWVAR
jgi:uncharacterized protein (TIGR03382 family)